MKELVRIPFSTVWKNPSPAQQQYIKDNKTEEIWVNDTYQVNVIRKIPCKGINDDNGNPITITHLSIKRKDKKAFIDWRHFQLIKNQLVGEENEGCEIYPAESRLVDTANQFHIWVFENPEMRLPFGFPARFVAENIGMGESQRPFHFLHKPKDLKESEEMMKKVLEEYGNKEKNEK
jgi:hypothetical protein